MRHVRALSFGNLKHYEKANEDYLKRSPDHPVHRPVQSLFTSGSGFNNFRGILNLGGFILVISTARMALENIINYGIVVDPFLWLRYILHSSYKFMALFLVIYSNVFILCAFFIERAVVNGLLKSTLAFILNCLNLAGTLMFPTAIILLYDFNPIFNCTMLASYTVVFLKLWSYASVNRWCRTAIEYKLPGQEEIVPPFASLNAVKKSSEPPGGSKRQSNRSSPYSSVEHISEPCGDNASTPCSKGETGKRFDEVPNAEAPVADTIEIHGTPVPLSRRSVDTTVQTGQQQSTSSKVTDDSDVTRRRHTIGVPSSARPKSQERGQLNRHYSVSAEQYISLVDIMEKEPQNLLAPSLETTEFRRYIYQEYPQNVTLTDLYYFMVAPTLCYELNFPRTVSISKLFLLKRLFELVFLAQLILCLIQQWMLPILRNSVRPIASSNISQVIERCLKLAIPNHFIWLLGFYTLFHSLLNILGELTYFGDRFFYSDWWNSESVAAFWSKWNIPVHRFCRRHVYVPLLESGYSRAQASLVVFFISALFHEFLVTVPLKMPCMWAFLGMLGQMPYALLVRFLFPHGGTWGNVAVWITLIIGQPMAILFYFHDYYLIHYAV